MSVIGRIRRLERQAAKRKRQSKPLFFKSNDEYERALRDGRVKNYHICYIDDVPEDD